PDAGPRSPLGRDRSRCPRPARGLGRAPADLERTRPRPLVGRARRDGDLRLAEAVGVRKEAPAMIEAVAILVGVGGCVAVAVSPLSPPSVPDPSSAHADALRRQERQLSALVLSFAAFCCLSLTAIGSGHPRMVLPMLGAMLLAILVVHPWTIVRAILIPLGLPRAAHAVTKLGGEPWVRDPNGGAVLAGALACRRRASVDPYDTRFLVERLADGPLRGAGIVAAALLAEDR